MTKAKAEPTPDFVMRLQTLGLRIQQPGDTPLFTPQPTSPMQPMHWRWSELEPLFDELSNHLSLKPGGDRRTLKLTNPGLESGTTPTLWASIQYILPGEVATAHRHTPEAFRFVMRGSGCFTTVDGERYAMNEGDLVLTPSWAWHDHIHEGDGPMIWLDVLDIPLVRALDAIFFEPYVEDVQPVLPHPDVSYREYGSGLLRPPGPRRPGSRRNPLLAYPKAVSDQALADMRGLDPDPNDDVIVEFQNPATGAQAMDTVSISMQVLRPGFSGRLHCHTGSKIYWVVEGSGTTTVGDRSFEWSEGDFLAIPSWAPHRHANASDHDSRLFRVDDTPVLRALGLYHEKVIDDSWTAARVH